MPEVYVDASRIVSGRTVLSGIRIDACHGSEDIERSQGLLTADASHWIGLTVFGYTAWGSSTVRPPDGQDLIASDGTVWRIGPSTDEERVSAAFGTAENRIELLVDAASAVPDPPYFVLEREHDRVSEFRCVVRLLVNTMAELPDYYCNVVRSAPSSVAYTDDGRAMGEPFLAKRARILAGRSIQDGDRFPICLESAPDPARGVAIVGRRIDRHIHEAALLFVGAIALLKPGDYLCRRTGFAFGDQRLEVSQRLAVVVEAV
jgi:hypothetical protein